MNVDESEIAKFSALAHRWWDPEGEMQVLHVINPVRLEWIASLVGSLQGLEVLDVGCGGGLFSEAMARQGARVTAIDLSEKALTVARLHQLESGLEIDYRLEAVEALAEREAGRYDLVVALEMLEHVPQPQSVVAAAARLLKPGGWAVFSTLNRTLKAYLLAIVGAEWLFGLLPRGTHTWSRFITPAELSRWCEAAGLIAVTGSGLWYNPFMRRAKLTPSMEVNYLLAARRV